MLIQIFFGVNIVEIVTKGLYPNSLDTFREYIQNSCDAIDDAIAAGILQKDEGRIGITINADERRITIEDNGIGISCGEKNFVRIMSNIGNSDKSLNTDRGFRGIGRLCGLAYCKTLVFSTKVAGERKISTLTIDAEKVRETFFHNNKFSAEQVLSANMFFSTYEAEDVDDHFFRVELIDIVTTNTTLLDVKKVRDYLSFVAPVTYNPNFNYQTEIYDHAAALNFKITEYKILVNKEPLSKPYKTNVQTRMGQDEIFGVDFRDFLDEAGNLIAWSWVGLSNFRGVIDQRSGTDDNKMRGIRLRAGNIQIGDESTFQKLFTETRGTNYFIGEVHAVDTNLRPNSRRDYFEENEACNAFETALKEYFNELHDMYYTSSEIRRAKKAINAPKAAEDEFNGQSAPYRKSHKEAHEEKIIKLKEDAKSAEKKILSLRQEAEQNPKTSWSRVVIHMTENQPESNPPPQGRTRRLQNRRLTSQRSSRRLIGRGNSVPFIGTLKTLWSTTRNLPAKLSSTRLKRSLPNEPPRPFNRAELEKQISASQPHEVGDVFSERVRRRRALFQGRTQTLCRAVVA